MTVQTAVLEGVMSEAGSAALLFAAIVAATLLFLWPGVTLPLPDVGIPWRQLLQNRTLGGLALSCRTLHDMCIARLELRRKQSLRR